MLITYKPFAVAAGSGFPGGGPLSNVPCMGPRFLSGAYPPRTFRFHKRHVERANYMHGLRSLASNLYLCELESGHKQGANDRRGQGSRAFHYKHQPRSRGIFPRCLRHLSLRVAFSATTRGARVAMSGEQPTTAVQKRGKREDAKGDTVNER